MATSTEWMPVFAIRRGARTIQAAHPDAKSVKQQEYGAASEDQFERIGTAFADAEGGFTIHFSTLPREGTLVMRPPKPHEQPNPEATRQI